MKTALYGGTACFVLLSTLGLVGCKSIERSEAIHKERLLAASGFQMRLADTPSRMNQLATLPMRKLVPVTQDGTLRYLYADNLGCKCIYVGSEKAYQRYQRLAIREHIANEQEEAALDLETTSFNWGGWGPWYSPWY